jgi:hypothetical protein
MTVAADYITQRSAADLAAAGSILEAVAEPKGDRWYVSVRIGSTYRLLRKHNTPEPREFATLDACGRFTHRLGIRRLVVDLAGWQPGQDDAWARRRARKRLPIGAHRS